MKLSKNQAKKYLLQMVQIRAFEEQAEKSYMSGKIHGTMHLSIGQEASAVGSISTLKSTDYIIGHHRGHGLCIAKGADLKLMMAELYGKENGYCRGKGGSMHIADISGGNLGANGVVGGGIPLAVGIGLGLKMQAKSQVLLAFFGDGAASTGAFHESMILAVLYQVPVVFICENNQYAMSFSARDWTSSQKIAAQGELYGMPGTATDGNDFFEVQKVVQIGVDRARKRGGPSLVVNDTYRWRGHARSDRNLYRTKEEIEEWKSKDPIARYQKYCIENNLISNEDVEKIWTQGYADIEVARQFAEDSPDPIIESLEDGVYAP